MYAAYVLDEISHRIVFIIAPQRQPLIEFIRELTSLGPHSVAYVEPDTCRIVENHGEVLVPTSPISEVVRLEQEDG